MLGRGQTQLAHACPQKRLVSRSPHRIDRVPPKAEPRGELSLQQGLLLDKGDDAVELLAFARSAERRHAGLYGEHFDRDEHLRESHPRCVNGIQQNDNTSAF